MRWWGKIENIGSLQSRHFGSNIESHKTLMSGGVVSARGGPAVYFGGQLAPIPHDFWQYFGL